MTRQRGGSGGGSCGREGRGGPSARNSPPPPPRRRRCVHCAEADRPTSRPTRRRLTASVRYCGCRSSASVHISNNPSSVHKSKQRGPRVSLSVSLSHVPCRLLDPFLHSSLTSEQIRTALHVFMSVPPPRAATASSFRGCVLIC